MILHDFPKFFLDSSFIAFYIVFTCGITIGFENFFGNLNIQIFFAFISGLSANDWKLEFISHIDMIFSFFNDSLHKISTIFLAGHNTLDGAKNSILKVFGEIGLLIF